MDIEQRLNFLANRYRSLGFKVVVYPGPDDLPPFAKDFKVELLATGPGGNVLTVAKGSPAELEADPNIPSYAELTEHQPGWRLEVLIVDPAGGLPAERWQAN